MEFIGIHHVSAVTARAQENVDFFTDVFGMRLVKKTVNQDDPTMYHLFYGDEKGNPGTELTFFEIRQAGQTYEGTNSISTTSLRVPSDEALQFWKERLTTYNVDHEEIKERAGRKTIRFRSFERQRLMLVSDENNANGVKGGTPKEHDEIPRKHGITGLGPMHITVAEAASTVQFLTEVMKFTEVMEYPADSEGQPDVIVLKTGAGGTGAEIHVEERTDLPIERPGRGSVHHLALRVADDRELRAWMKRLDGHGYSHSGYVDRFYFHSVYIPSPNGILVELATDGPGFAIDEPLKKLGESLALPPFLEDRREEIAARLTPVK